MLTTTMTKIDNLKKDLPFRFEDEDRLQRLTKKQDSEMFEVAFCGHFSAGKSTLLNDLLGGPVLPTSPIPTSANIIHVKNGPVSLVAEKQDGSKEQWNGNIPWNELREWGKDGASIRRILLTLPLPYLGDHGSMMDTPGVDSTDDNHQHVTMEELYTTDAVVYVTDYNHVQSETNIKFLQQLTREQKPFFLVVNQLDKHNEKEISFNLYKHSVKDMLEKENIQPIHIYFTSMKDADHPENELNTFKKHMKALFYNSQELLDESKENMVAGIVQSLRERIASEEEEARQQWLEELEQKGMDSRLIENREQREQERKQIESEEKESIKSLYKERDQLLSNVILFPYSTTEKAREWLESMHPRFKVGLLRTKKKTEEERERRLSALLSELNDNIERNLIFHIRDIASKGKEGQLADPETFEEKLSQLSCTLTKDDLTQYVTTAEMDRQFVYSFTDKVTADVVKKIKQQSMDLFAQSEEAVRKSYETQKERLNAELEKAQQFHEEEEEWEQQKVHFETEIARCDEWLATVNSVENLRRHFIQLLDKEAPTEVEHFLDDVIIDEEETDIQDEIPDLYEVEEERDDSWLEPLRQHVEKGTELTFLNREINEIKDQLRRYDEPGGVISLFGAFSAGKSSFINAMLGEDLLPVSPHPTTATVNRITKSDENHPHGTVRIQIKNESALDAEIQKVAREVGEDVSFHNIQQWQPPASSSATTSWQKQHLTYLRTLKQSLSRRAFPLGETMEVSREELADVVAKEEKSALLEEVILHYDGKWTSRGIEFIDTPGVNSMHGRHTNVAFEHMRKSDAIFYVTYYNHAFTKADQYFLQQMAKANDSFYENKMYFILNAADLAKNKGELQQVMNHIKGQMQANGFTEPQLFALSSKEGLNEKQSGHGQSEQSAFSRFETYIEQRVLTDMKNGAYDALYQETVDMKQWLQRTWESFAVDREEREEQWAKQKVVMETQRKYCQDFSLRHYRDELQREAEQQLVYLSQRAAFIMNDTFADAINPTVITSDRKKEARNQLIGAIQAFEGFVRQFLSKELAAIFIRIEQAVQRRGQKQIATWNQELKRHIPHLRTPAHNLDVSIRTNKNVDGFSLDRERLASMMKSKRDFFEQGGVKSLKEKMVEEGMEDIRERIEDMKQEMQQVLTKTMNEVEKQAATHLSLIIHEEEARMASTLDESMKPAIEKELERWRHLVDQASSSQ